MDSQPYPYEVEAKSTSMDRFYIIDADGQKYRLWFEVRKALGPKVMQVVIGKAESNPKIYKKVIQRFENPMRLFATMMVIFKEGVKGGDQYMKVQDGFAFALPEGQFDRFESLLGRVIKRVLTGTPFEEVQDNVSFTNEEFFYLPIIKKGKKAAEVFQGKEVVSAPSSAPSPAPAPAASPAPAPAPAPKAANPVVGALKAMASKPAQHKLTKEQVEHLQQDLKDGIQIFDDPIIGIWALMPSGKLIPMATYARWANPVLKALNDEDPQRRGGNYPRSNVPDHIQCSVSGGKAFGELSFKNTTEQTAGAYLKNWLASKFPGKVLNGLSISVMQEGDYQDDWVRAAFTFELVKNPAVLPDSSNATQASGFDEASAKEWLTNEPIRGNILKGKPSVSEIKANLLAKVGSTSWESKTNQYRESIMVAKVGGKELIVKPMVVTVYKNSGRLRIPSGTRYEAFINVNYDGKFLGSVTFGTATGETQASNDKMTKAKESMKSFLEKLTKSQITGTLWYNT